VYFEVVFLDGTNRRFPLLFTMVSEKSCRLKLVISSGRKTREAMLCEHHMKSTFESAFTNSGWFRTFANFKYRLRLFDVFTITRGIFPVLPDVKSARDGRPST